MAKVPSKKLRILVWILIPLATIIAFVGGYFSKYLIDGHTASTVNDVIRLMQNVGYVYDENTGEMKELSAEQISDLLVYVFLDEYSAYYTAEEYATVNAKSRGNFSGTGISFYDLDNVIDFISLNSIADKKGVKVGQKIISCNLAGNEPVSVSNLNDFSIFMSSVEFGQPFFLTVETSDGNQTIELVKEQYIASYVEYYDSQSTLRFRSEGVAKPEKKIFSAEKNLPNDTACIALTEFNGNAGEQFGQALEYMKEQGRTKLIVDLRNNGGGYTTVLSSVASYLIDNQGENRSLISFAQGKKFNQSMYTNGNYFNREITDIAVLANQNTASASECLIGAMLHYGGERFSQDNLIIEKYEGQAKTYGKGIMQTTYGLISGGALKLTTAKIFLPDKITSIHGKGFIASGANAVEQGKALERAIELLS